MSAHDSDATGRAQEVQSLSSSPASPRSIASLPSPPSSPTPADQISLPDSPNSLASDFPMSSLSSSLYLSGTSSPGLGPQPSVHPTDYGVTRTLVIPSLNVPQFDPGRGDAVGNIKLWVIGAGLADCQAAAESIIREAPLVSEVGEWSFSGDGIATFRASTLSGVHQSIPRSMVHDARWNVHVYVADVSVDSRTQPASMLDSILAAVQTPFMSTDRLLNDSEPSTTSFLPLLTSSTTHLHTAVVYLRSSPSTRHDQLMINELAPYIPVITLPYPPPPHTASSSNHSQHHFSHNHHHNYYPSSADAAATSTFRPHSLAHLRDSLFLNPSVLHHLRTEAGERFLRWRDLSAALRQPDSPTVHPLDVISSRDGILGIGTTTSTTNPMRPFQTRGRAASMSSVGRSSDRSSGGGMLIFGSSQSTVVHHISTPQRPGHSRANLSSSPLGLAGVNEEEDDSEDGYHSAGDEPRQPDWMWDWESRFSRDVREQQKRRSPNSSSNLGAGTTAGGAGGVGQSLTSSTRPTLSTLRTTMGIGAGAGTTGITPRIPLAAATSESTMLELGTELDPPPTLGTLRSYSHLRQRQQQRLHPSMLHHDVSPPRHDAGDERESERGPEHEEYDPLHMRSVARLAVSVIPALIRRYFVPLPLLRPRRQQQQQQRLLTSGSARSRSSTRRHKEKKEEDGQEGGGGGGKLSWGMFGLGVSVGVVLSICIVGIGIELSQLVWNGA
ncbi:hypothetical protein DL93DRAFT_2099431 [Clavulina sp. PMI_390]|nr:hypothetical protein DL93DRAFT_2099431 [Clavulina sp. PMI_390]